MAKESRVTIGTLAERSLHAALKQYLAREGDQFEVKLGRYWIDIVSAHELIEIQTRSLRAIAPKLRVLTREHHVRLVHPIAIEKWVVRQDKNGNTLSRRRSPRRGRVEHIFDELVGCADVMTLPNLTLDILLTREEAISEPTIRKRWRTVGWRVTDRRLLEVVAQRSFVGTSDWLTLLADLPHAPFTNADVAHALSVPIEIAQRLTYCYRGAGLIHASGKRGRALMFERVVGDTIEESDYAKREFEMS